MEEKFVTIHGDKWKSKDVEEPIEWARTQKWEKRKWHPRATLVSKGKTSDYVGQKYNSEYTKLEEDGWTHDHCEICWWTIHESDNREEGIGYTTDGHRWLCSECYEQFIANKTQQFASPDCGDAARPLPVGSAVRPRNGKEETLTGKSNEMFKVLSLRRLLELGGEEKPADEREAARKEIINTQIRKQLSLKEKLTNMW